MVLVLYLLLVPLFSMMGFVVGWSNRDGADGQGRVESQLIWFGFQSLTKMWGMG